MEDYRSNSNRSKQENSRAEAPEKKEHKPLKGSVKIKKQNKFLKAFIKEDVDDVKDYIFDNVIVPSVIDLILNTVNNTLSMFFKGETSRRSYDRGERENYRRYYNDRREPDRGYSSRRNRSTYSNVIFEDKDDALDKLEELDKMLEKYKAVSVLDLYDLLDYPSEPTDDKYGWTNLDSAKVVPVSDGWMLKLPRPLPLD